MKLINKILILIIIIFLINHLTNGKILNTLKRYLTLCKTKIEKFIGNSEDKPSISLNPQNSTVKPQDFQMINPNDEDLYLLYRFVNNMVMPNINIYEIINNKKSKKTLVDDKLNNEILDQIKKMFNTNGYKFANIKILTPINFYQTFRGKYLETFYFSSDVTHLEKQLGTIIIGIESFLREDETSDKNMVRYLSIINVELGKKSNPFNNLKDTTLDKKIEINYVQNKNPELSKNEIDAIETAKQLAMQMDNSFDNFVPRDNYDDLFIKQRNIQSETNNDTDSLIPSNIELSYEPQSITISSNK